jgi:hypothetical protein
MKPINVVINFNPSITLEALNEDVLWESTPTLLLGIHTKYFDGKVWLHSYKSNRDTLLIPLYLNSIALSKKSTSFGL